MPDPLLVRIGLRVHALRKASGLSRASLASRTGLSPRFLGEVERGTGNIAVTRLAKLAEALDTTPAKLLEGRDWPHSVRRPVLSLLGVRGAGKSTLGRMLARDLSVAFHEHDRLVEEAAGMELRELFALHGDGYYRRLAREALERFLSHVAEPSILATSGGVVADPEAFDLLRRLSHTVWLKASWRDHWDRVVAQGDRRPMTDHPEAQEELRRLLVHREPLYALAEKRVDTTRLGFSEARKALKVMMAQVLEAHRESAAD